MDENVCQSRPSVPLTHDQRSRSQEVAMRIATHARTPLAGRILAAVGATLFACTEHPAVTAPGTNAIVASRDREDGPPLHFSAKGQFIFRHWTFGDEPFWTDTLHLNQVIETGVSPATALAVGLKVDAERLPAGFLGSADLTSPATTVELLRRAPRVGGGAAVTAGRQIQRPGGDRTKGRWGKKGES